MASLTMRLCVSRKLACLAFFALAALLAVGRYSHRTLLRLADQRMHAAKAAGRNRVMGAASQPAAQAVWAC